MNGQMTSLKEEEPENLEGGKPFLKSGEIAALEIIGDRNREEQERLKIAEYAASVKGDKTTTPETSCLKEEEGGCVEGGEIFLKSGEIAALQIIGDRNREEQERLKIAEYSASDKGKKTIALNSEEKTEGITPEKVKRAECCSDNTSNDATYQSACVMETVKERASMASTNIAMEGSLLSQSAVSDQSSSGATRVGAFSRHPGNQAPSERRILDYNRAMNPKNAANTKLESELRSSLQYEMGGSDLSYSDPDPLPLALDKIRDAESGLAVAQPVDEESAAPGLMEAQEMDLSKARRMARQKKKTLLLQVLSFGVAAILVLVLLLVFLYPKNEPSTDVIETDSPTAAPTVEVTLSPKDFVLSLLPEYTLVALDQVQGDSPQSKALEWMLGDPNLTNYSVSRIIQRFALATFFHSTGGYGWTNSTNWMSYEVHECQWHHQDVRMLFGLFGDLPEADLQFLRPLVLESPPCANEEYTHLWLFMNGLHGTIPPEICLLTTLTSVGLLINQLTGAVFPPDVAKLSLLELYATLATPLTGTIPTEVGLLSNLNSLRLSRSQIGGAIPSQLGLLSNNLKVLDLADNQLIGVIPPALGSMKNLSVLSLQINQLSGSLPSEIGLLKEAELLELGMNRFEGVIPSELGALQNASEISLDTNGLTGTVPMELANLVTGGNLKTLYLSNNSLTGTIPKELCWVETVTNYNSTLLGCNCTCPIVHYHLDPSPDLCSSLPGCT